MKGATIKPLSNEDRHHAFLRATGGMNKSSDRWAKRAETGLSDDELADALKCELGIFGGRGGPDQLDITYQGAGLKIWATWEVINHCAIAPIFQGAKTIAMAREIYGITDPDDKQMGLF